MRTRFKEMRKRMGIVAGCALMLLCSAVSASAAIPSDLSRNLSLRVTCAPAGDTAEGMRFRFYYIASVDEDGHYTIVPPYDSTGITEDMLRYTSERAAAVQLLGRYINENGTSADLEGATAANGQAVIQGMADGIYLAASNTAYRLPDGTSYTPVPFVFRLDAALVQDAAEASTDEYTVIAKFLVTGQDDGGNAGEGGNGDSGIGGSTSNYVTGRTVRRGGSGGGSGTGGAGMGAAGTGGTPLTSIGDEGVPQSTTTIRDEGVPQSGEPSIELLDDDVPLADMPDDQGALDMPDDPVPLAMLPQTGLLWWPVPILMVLGLFLAVTGWAKRRG